MATWKDEYYGKKAMIIMGSNMWTKVINANSPPTNQDDVIISNDIY